MKGFDTIFATVDGTEIHCNKEDWSIIMGQYVIVGPKYIDGKLKMDAKIDLLIALEEGSANISIPMTNIKFSICQPKRS